MRELRGALAGFCDELRQSLDAIEGVESGDQEVCIAILFIDLDRCRRIAGGGEFIVAPLVAVETWPGVILASEHVASTQLRNGSAPRRMRQQDLVAGWRVLPTDAPGTRNGALWRVKQASDGRKQRSAAR